MRQYVILPFLVIILMLAGCSSNNDDPNEQGSLKDRDVQDVKEVQEVKVSRSLQFGVVNEAILGIFTEQADVELFIDAIDTAKKIEGQLDISRPDYDVTLSTKEAEYSIHLWLDPVVDGGMYTLISDTGTGYTLTEESASGLKRLIMGVPYTSEQAEQNGDIVNMHGKLLNQDKWDTFLTNVQGGTNDHVQITSYTIEGDPIFYNFNFSGQAIEYTFDTTMDAFGSPQRTTRFCERIVSKIIYEGTEYSLAGCQGNKDIDETFRLVVPKS